MSNRKSYTLSSYGRMIADRVRTDAYTEALRRAMRPGAVVLDIGTGPGILAMLACRLGARRVYAVEPDDVIEVARATAYDNGFSDRIEFIQDVSTSVSLPEQADVIVSDLHGVLPLFQHLIPSIADARRRLLAPRGSIIPQSESLWLALVEAPEIYREHLAPFDENVYGLDLKTARRLVVNTWRKTFCEQEQLLVPPRSWAVLDYSLIENPNVSSETHWVAERSGTAHAVIAWFDTILCEGVGFSNAPGEPELIYSQAFFPLEEPVVITPGDEISVKLHANLVGEDYLWRWEFSSRAPGSEAAIKAEFKQSTFYGVPFSPQSLRKRSPGYAPALNEEGEINLFLLSLADGKRTSNEIALLLAERFPSRFADARETLNRVSEIFRDYGQ